MLSAALIGGETPQRQYWHISWASVLLHGELLIFVVNEALLVGVLHNKALHNLEASLHGSRVNGILLSHLDYLGGLFLFLLALGGLLHLLTGHLLPSGHVSVEDHPLGGFYREDRPLWWFSLHSLRPDRQVEGLRRALLVIELVTE